MAISQIQDLGNGYYVLQMTDRKESEVPPLEKVTDRVKADLVKSMQDQRAKADAEAFKKKVEEGATFAAAAAGTNAELDETGLFSRSGAIPKIGYEPQIQQDAFKLTREKPLLPDVAQGRQGWYVLRLKDRQAPEDAGFAKEKVDIVKRLTEQEKQAVFQSWLEDLRSQAKIEINEELTKI